jgi:hypothetical protein
MEIAIFRNKNTNALQDDINGFLDQHGDGIDVIQIVQSLSGSELAVTILFRVTGVLDGF